jgi:hypothetical protein
MTMAQGILPATKWRNGRVRHSRAAKQIEQHQKSVEEAEMRVVLAQPHRRGSRSQLRENALGRFIEDNRLRMALYNAGREYGALKSKWRAAKGAPMPDRLGGSGADIDAAIVIAWGRTIVRCEDAVMSCRSIDPRAYGPAALGYVEWLCCDGKDFPQNGDWRDATCGMLVLAVELGTIEQKEVDRRGLQAAYAD